MKVDIIKKTQTYAIARDSEGNEYPIKGFEVREECSEEILKEGVEGSLVTEHEPDYYEDGSMARSYTEITYFKNKLR